MQSLLLAENERLVVIQVLEVINGSSKKVKFLLTDATVQSTSFLVLLIIDQMDTKSNVTTDVK
jgi:septum formation inhibitor-activating ATPase MinD